jgi:hypothetical protein
MPVKRKHEDEIRTTPRSEAYEPPQLKVFDLRMVVVGSGTAFNDSTGDVSPPGDLPGPVDR